MNEEPKTDYAIKLDIFEGPLDLLLYLIKKNQIDIYNIPIALITRQYLDYLNLIKSLNLDLAGEYLVMASTLIHIKSRLLLPVPEEPSPEELEDDPRSELVRQLLEHQAFKEAADLLTRRPILERDVFKRAAALPEEKRSSGAEEEELVEASIFELIEAFHQIVSRLDQKELLEIDLEKLSLSDIINDVMERLTREKNLTFDELLGEKRERRRIVYTFLALLELIKLKMIKAYQTAAFGVIRIFPAVEL
ncbi:MAG TPA: segregation/condensation protein A [Smithellaceae bacterium]|jgi:segregation and condensation protein A|nr:segregation/condensation protein A [Syntrophaceae bacterium]NMC90258.1 segregation/condensation protein A [Smithella sp.]HNV56611.1 segregation/condensation protein A [Smithellaceae bacterium]MBP8666099.1 segregation/condensation protein A [Syntrophaceae bacterium]MBP9531912.1 segregation/condensation protein A [Syntrophaceae bacterium]